MHEGNMQRIVFENKTCQHAILSIKLSHNKSEKQKKEKICEGERAVTSDGRSADQQDQPASREHTAQHNTKSI